jgi:hypothetical protein
MVVLVVDRAFVMDWDGAADLDFFVMRYWRRLVRQLMSLRHVESGERVIGRGSVKLFGLTDIAFLFNVNY